MTTTRPSPSRRLARVGLFMLAIAILPLAATELQAQEGSGEVQGSGEVTLPETGVLSSGSLAILSRPARLVVREVPMRAAIDALQRNSGISIAYSPSLLPTDRLVTCLCESATVAGAIDTLLEGTGLEFSVAAGQVVIRPQPASGSSARLAAAPTGSAVTPIRQAAIQGIVTDGVSGQPLEGASVILEAQGEPVRSAITDRNGFYQISTIVPGSYTLRVGQLGYIPHQEPLVLESGEQRTVSVGLARDPLVLEGVIVVAPGGGVVRRELGRQLVTPGQMRLVPTPAATGDLTSYLQTLPGVIATGDRGGQLFIRGGTHTENLTLMDGMLIYQPFHIVGFFSVFPEDLVSSADFYAGGFGARYSGRTSSVLDVQMRDGNRNQLEAAGSVSPFLAEARVEGPLGEGGRVSWLASARSSLIEHTSPTIAGERQPLGFESQFLKVTSFDEVGSRCSGTALRTVDRGRLDVVDDGSRVSWSNLAVGGRCLVLVNRGILRLMDVSLGYSSVRNEAIVRGTSELSSDIQRFHMDVNTTNVLGGSSFEAGYFIRLEEMAYNLSELVGLRTESEYIWGLGAYTEAGFSLGERLNLQPGVVLTLSPVVGLEPRLRGSWQPLDGVDGELSGAVGLYRQELTGISDTRDIGSVFVAWKRFSGERPGQAIHAQLGWQHSVGPRFDWGLEGYYKRIGQVPVPLWTTTAQFNTTLALADGQVYGADARIEYDHPRFYGFLGYGFSWTRYESAQDHFNTWFGEPVQYFHPPHDRRHQVSALLSVNMGRYTAGARWQLGSGFPFTRPMGFDETFDFRFRLLNVSAFPGTTRVILDRPYQARLPMVHRLDISIDRTFDLPFGSLEAQAGAVNVYDRTNMFFYDIYTHRRVDQLPLVPYLSLKLGSR